MSVPSISTRPPRAGISRAAASAVVDFPEPDSPTRPRVRPGATSKDTPSTAYNCAGLLNRPSRLTAKRTSRSRTRNTGRPALPPVLAVLRAAFMPGPLPRAGWPPRSASR